MDVNCLEIFRRQTLDFNLNWLRWIKSTYNSNTRGTWKQMCSRTFITRMRGISFENHQWILYFQLTQFPFPHLPAILKNSISFGSLSGLLKTKVYSSFFLSSCAVDQAPEWFSWYRFGGRSWHTAGKSLRQWYLAQFLRVQIGPRQNRRRTPGGKWPGPSRENACTGANHLQVSPSCGDAGCSKE